MRLPPNLDGHGGSQRAWYLVEALRPHGKAHFVLVFRDSDHDCVGTSLAPIELLVESVTRINIAGWQGAQRKRFRVVPIKVLDAARIRSHEPPHFFRRQIHDIAARLPIKKANIIFAG